MRKSFLGEWSHKLAFYEQRLRESSDEHKVRGDQLIGENERLRERLEEVVQERERLRTEHIAVASEKAALKRELELVRTETDMLHVQ